jgi:TonB family protein
VIAGPPVDAFYPDISRRLLEEGPVTVYFRLEQAEGPATNIWVGQSSLSAQLDEAAALYIANQTFKVACPQNQFRLRVRFKLQDEAPPPAPAATP